MLWFPELTGIVVQQATPMTSLTPLFTVPTSTSGIFLHPTNLSAAQQNTAPGVVTFPPLMDVQEPPFTLNAPMLLDISTPTIHLTKTRSPRPSSAANLFYSNIGKITSLPLPADLCGYHNLSTERRYHPNQVDPTLEPSIEADAIRACHHHIVSPVNMVLFDHSYTIATTGQYCRIRTKSEDTHSVSVWTGSEHVGHVSRVDLGWEVLIGTSWFKFAFLEFKRPGTLKEEDWAAATLGTGPVTGAGEKICRQMVKYGYSWGVRFICICDWQSLILLNLQGNIAEWFDAEQNPPRIEAKGFRISDRNRMKRALFVFLKLALQSYFLERNIAFR